MNTVNSHDKHCITSLYIIAARKLSDSLLTTLIKEDASLITTYYAKGSVKSKGLSEIFGFIHEENKVLITCLVREESVERIFAILRDRHDFTKPNTGIAFTVQVDSFSF